MGSDRLVAPLIAPTVAFPASSYGKTSTPVGNGYAVAFGESSRGKHSLKQSFIKLVN